MTYVLPAMGAYSDFGAEVTAIQTRLGEGKLVRVGFSFFIHVSMTDWNVDTTNTAAVRAALASTIGQIDAVVAQGVHYNIPICLSILTPVKGTYSPAEISSELEDRRNAQWYTDNAMAPGWWSTSQYARKQRRVQEAYIRELGKVVANYMSRFPDTVVAATGDGEVELSFKRFPDIVFASTASWTDYSPFAVAEFRDWLRGRGLYEAGQKLAGQGYVNRARYAGDLSPASDDNGDGHTLNGDFGTTFSSWNLRYFDWSLTDNPDIDPNAIPAAAYNTAGWNPLPDRGSTFFDAPRVRNDGSPFWQAWIRFRQEMIWRNNVEFAKWMTTSADPETGATIPAERWYGDQVPADYLFYNPDKHGPNDEGVRLFTSASPWWTGDVSPYGGIGITAYNVNGGDGKTFYKTLKYVAPSIAARNTRWGIIEWNPSDPFTMDPMVYRQDMDVVAQYRPHLMIPFMWNDPHYRVLDSGFEVALRELIARIKDPSPSKPQMAIDKPAANQVSKQPFQLTGWAIDQGTVIGPGWSTGVDAVHVYAYPNPGSGEPRVDLGSATYGAARPDVASSYGAQFGTAGFALTVSGLPSGKYEIVAEARSTVTNTFSAVQRVVVGVDVPGLSADKSSLRFSVIRNTSSTGAQVVALSQTGAGTVNWTAAASASWLQVSPGSGKGAGQLSIQVNQADAGLQTVGTVTGRVTVSSPESFNSVTIDVTVTVSAPAATAAPFGQVDTPAQNAIGVVGAIGVTGWALDDVGVSSVKIYRNCLAFDSPASCQMIGGASVVFVGDAAFLAGARPDVEATYPGYPQAYRAGWGYLLLTNMLPDVTNRQGYGGQGPLTLYAFATDVEGKTTLLGRSQIDHTPTSMTMANVSIGKPFGAIDTPAQGQTVSGILPNFGWALTPDTDELAGAGDILVPPSGSTMVVFIDGISTALVAYNQCRGNVGNPVPGIAYCNDDVANVFGNMAPQPTLTARTSNPTKYRNLDAGRAAIGAYDLDTTQLTNGLHTIAWSVTDSAGRNEGIGSRFFTVLNTGGDAGRSRGDQVLGPRGRSSAAGRSRGSLDPQAGEPVAGILGAVSPFLAQVLPAELLAAALRQAAPALPRGDARNVAALPLADALVWARTGFDLGVPYDQVLPDEDGVRRLVLPETGRLELWLGSVEAGSLVANGTLRDLPPGSRLDSAMGLFTWMPGPGYIGTYHLVFLRDGHQIALEITIRPD